MNKTYDNKNYKEYILSYDRNVLQNLQLCEAICPRYQNLQFW